MSLIRALVLVVLASLSLHAYCVVPEKGLYWDPLNPGRGYYIEVQNGVVVMIAYAYNNDGGPEFYIAAGPLQQGAFTQFDPTPYEPRHGFTGNIYRSTGGPCLGCAPNSVDPNKRVETVVGTIAMDFISMDFAYAEILMNDGHSTYLDLQRENFAYPPLFVIPNTDGAESMPDLRGEWLFSDQTDSTRPAWRFVFTDYTLTHEVVNGTAIDVYTFHDATRGADFRCLIWYSCELRQNGQSLFSVFVGDFGIHQMQGVLGPAVNFPTPNRGARDGKMVIGVRIEKEPPAPSN